MYINCTDTYLKLGFNCNLEGDTQEAKHTAISQTAIFPCALLSLLLSVNIDSIACPSSFHQHKQPWWQGTPSLMSLLDTPHRSVDDQASFHSCIVVVTCIGIVSCGWTQRLIGWCFAIQWEVITQVSQGKLYQTIHDHHTERSTDIKTIRHHQGRHPGRHPGNPTDRKTSNHRVIQAIRHPDRQASRRVIIESSRQTEAPASRQAIIEASRQTDRQASRKSVIQTDRQ